MQLACVDALVARASAASRPARPPPRHRLTSAAAPRWPRGGARPAVRGCASTREGEGRSARWVGGWVGGGTGGAGVRFGGGDEAGWGWGVEV